MFKELLKEEYKDVYLDYFQKEAKGFRTTRLIYGLVLFLIFSLGILILNKPVWLLMTPIMFYVGYKLPYYSLISLKKSDTIKVSFLFPQFSQSFMALISSSGNVYQALKASVPYTSDPLKRELEKLVKAIEVDNDREHYIRFAEFIETNEAYTIMDIIYGFSERGVKKDSLQELQAYIQDLDENKTNQLVETKLGRAEKYGLSTIFIAMFLLLGYTGSIMFYYFDDVMDALSVL